jgi:predicted phage tail protein
LVLALNIPKTERAMKKAEQRGLMRSSEMEYLKLSRLENDDLDQRTNIKRTELTGTLANLAIFEIVVARQAAQWF